MLLIHLFEECQLVVKERNKVGKVTSSDAFDLARRYLLHLMRTTSLRKQQDRLQHQQHQEGREREVKLQTNLLLLCP